MELSRTDDVKVMYFPSLERNLHNGKDVMCLNFRNIFYIFSDILMQKLSSLA